MNPGKPNRLQEIAHQYLEKTAADGRNQRLLEQRMARLAVDTYLLPLERVSEILAIEPETLNLMLTAGGITLSADCAQLRHLGCNGNHWNDTTQQPAYCQCPCHDEVAEILDAA